ncbi:hypothetical protein [Hoeflea prorocentri]|uniref:Uncharacterized protein n=1 Tax=Hoeflea prorocentri TaxID=1922333 RepID=A0A9X3ZHK0_9HYPH|nr:hypothetical protein [Hoeflea prorocentri]MCY6380956.1 hypothetical protein [Hoeflea prorocentri]MDA5398756.1 hypothetical protein [Hoeflea prorocentri]
MSDPCKPAGLPWSSLIALCVVAASIIAAFTTLRSNVSANVSDVAEMERRMDRLEERSGDVRERLKAIEVIQQQQNQTLERILEAVER